MMKNVLAKPPQCTCTLPGPVSWADPRATVPPLAMSALDTVQLTDEIPPHSLPPGKMAKKPLPPVCVTVRLYVTAPDVSGILGTPSTSVQMGCWTVLPETRRPASP